MRKKKTCYSPEEKEYIAAMDRLHFQPENKMAIVNRVVSEAGNRVTHGEDEEHKAAPLDAFDELSRGS